MAFSSSAVLPSRMKWSTTSPQYFFTRYPLMRASGVRKTKEGGKSRLAPVSTRGITSSSLSVSVELSEIWWTAATPFSTAFSAGSKEMSVVMHTSTMFLPGRRSCTSRPVSVQGPVFLIL